MSDSHQDEGGKSIAAVDREILRTLITLSVQMEQVNKQIVALDARIQQSENDLKDRNDKNEMTYVTKMEFIPYQRLLQGLIGLVLSSVFAALLALVLKVQ